MVNRTTNFLHIISIYMLVQCGNVMGASLLPQYKSIGDYTIGRVNINDIAKTIGADIYDKQVESGTIKTTCHYSNHSGQKLLIRYGSGAMGGWSTLTEFSVEKVSEKNDSQCVEYQITAPVIELLGLDKSYIMNKFDIKSSAEERVLKIERTTVSALNPEAETFSGMYFTFDRSNLVERIFVFEVESN